MSGRLGFLAGVVVALVLCAGIGVASAGSGSGGGCRDADARPGTVAKSRVKAAVLCLVNHERGQRGLARLVANRQQRRAAVAHNRFMIRKKCFAHRCSGEADLVTRLTRSGYLPCDCLWTVGENIAWGADRYSTPRSTVRRWMHSPPHRKNILDAGFRHIGIAVHTGTPARGIADGATYTTDFGVRR